MIEKDKLVKAEIKRLENIFKDMPQTEKTVVKGLIVQAARIRISLDEMWLDIVENGETEYFTQSEKTDPYERQRPISQIFTQRDKSYQTIIKLLCDRLPEGENAKDKGREIMEFISKGKR